MYAQTKKKTEANDPVSDMKTHEEIFDSLPEKEAEKGYSKKDTDPRKVAEAAGNANGTIAITEKSLEVRLERFGETATKIGGASEAPLPRIHHPSGKDWARNTDRTAREGTELSPSRYPTQKTEHVNPEFSPPQDPSPSGRVSSRSLSRDIRGGSESSLFRPTSARSNTETSLSPWHHPLGRAISDEKRSSEK